MSWIFGFYSKEKVASDVLSKHHPQAIASINIDKCYIAIGGNKNMVVFNDTDAQNKYFICGAAISNNFENVLTNENWQTIISNHPKDIAELNGHFCGVSVNNNSLNLFTDPLGLREFHIYENQDGWYFSTRLDWLLKLNCFEIDFNEFGSRWLLTNQISNKSIIKNIFRLNCGAKATLENNQCVTLQYNWMPTTGSYITTDDFKNELNKIIKLGLNQNSNLSLSLSGGLDSRVILSFLVNSKNKNWNCHTFQNNDTTDYNIASQICKDLNIRHHKISNDIAGSQNIISDLFEYIGSTYLAGSGFTSLNLTHYKFLPQDEIIIDGGFGEIWRREFLNRLYHLGRKDLEQNNFNKIPRYFLNRRAELFSADCNSFMNNGVVEQIENLMNQLPAIKEIGLGNWLDIFSIKTRLSNFYAPEQARIDNFIKSFMPFAQPELLNVLFSLPVSERINNRLFKKIIKLNCPQLTKYNLAKGKMPYPYYFTPLMKRAYIRMYNKFKPESEHSDFDSFLIEMKEFIMDSLRSKSAQEYAPYNYKFIFNKIDSYYKGVDSDRNFVDWFLTFEIFRQILQQKQS